MQVCKQKRSPRGLPLLLYLKWSQGALENRCCATRETTFCKKRLVRPYGLPVRSLRTHSQKPSDWEFSLIGLNASLR